MLVITVRLDFGKQLIYRLPFIIHVIIVSVYVKEKLLIRTNICKVKSRVLFML